jgi:hypothetical protein
MTQRKHSFARELVLALIAAVIIELALATCSGPSHLTLDLHLGAAVDHSAPHAGP